MPRFPVLAALRSAMARPHQSWPSSPWQHPNYQHCQCRRPRVASPPAPHLLLVAEEHWALVSRNMNAFDHLTTFTFAFSGYRVDAKLAGCAGATLVLVPANLPHAALNHYLHVPCASLVRFVILDSSCFRFEQWQKEITKFLCNDVKAMQQGTAHPER